MNFEPTEGSKGRYFHRANGGNQTVLLKCWRMCGWEAGTRTPIRRSRVCSLTIRRPPRELYFNIRVR